MFKRLKESLNEASNSIKLNALELDTLNETGLDEVNSEMNAFRIAEENAIDEIFEECIALGGKTSIDTFFLTESDDLEQEIEDDTLLTGRDIDFDVDIDAGELDTTGDDVSGECTPDDIEDGIDDIDDEEEQLI